MLEVIFDTETDGFRPTKLHSLAVIIPQTSDTFSFTDQPHDGSLPIADGLDLLRAADVLIGHNIINFDLRILRNLYELQLKPGAAIHDTLVAARLLWPDPTDSDTEAGLPAKLIGRHSLKAWGYRLGILKGTFGETTDWRQWTPQMQAYCQQDALVTAALHLHILEQQ